MNDERIIAYLLKELPEEDMERFEEECFYNCFDEESGLTQLEVVEDQLIDAYLHHKLTAEQRQRFESNYLIPGPRRERVVMATALLRLVDEDNAASKTATDKTPDEQTWTKRLQAVWSSQPWALRSAAAVAFVAMLAGPIYYFLFPASPRTFTTLALTISNTNRAEGSQAAKVKLPPEADDLKIFLTIPQPSAPPARYRVELEDDNGEAKSVEVAEQDAQSVRVVIPAKQLPQGQYALKLFAIKPDGSEQRIAGRYIFVVE